MVAAGYLLASFPDVEFDRESQAIAHITPARFEEDCRIMLPIKDADLVMEAVLSPEQSTLPVAQAWNVFSTSLRYEQAKIRWGRMKSGYFPQQKASEVSADALRAASLIQQAEHPLEAQLQFFRVRWDFLEALDSQYQQALENVIIYGWKVQELQLLIEIKKEKGKETWNQLVSKLTEKAGFSPTAITEGVAL